MEAGPRTAEPLPEPRSWRLTDDYLADPAVAPLRALLAALVRRWRARAIPSASLPR